MSGAEVLARYFPRNGYERTFLKGRAALCCGRGGGKTGRQMLCSGITSVCSPGLGFRSVVRSFWRTGLFCVLPGWGCRSYFLSSFGSSQSTPTLVFWDKVGSVTGLFGPFAEISLSVCFNSNYESF